jgi:hypothetical protein
MADSPLINITIRGAGVAIIGGGIYAALITPPNATTWIASAGPDGTIAFADQASGLVLSAPSTDPGTQATATPPGLPAAVTARRVVQYSDSSADEPTPVTDPSQLSSGFYAILVPGTQQYLYRNRIEDLSLMPKRVAVQPAGPLSGRRSSGRGL